MSTYNGFTDSNEEQTRARWQLMQKRAAAIAQAQQTGQAGETQPEPSQGEQ